MTIGELPSHQALHVISDLHMGGTRGFQVLRETTRLGQRVDALASERPGQSLALVLNGDVFDTLDEDIPGYVADDNAEQTVLRCAHIAENEAVKRANHDTSEVLRARSGPQLPQCGRHGPRPPSRSSLGFGDPTASQKRHKSMRAL